MLEFFVLTLKIRIWKWSTSLNITLQPSFSRTLGVFVHYTTAQSGIEPIILPPINIVALVASSEPDSSISDTSPAKNCPIVLPLYFSYVLIIPASMKNWLVETAMSSFTLLSRRAMRVYVFPIFYLESMN